MKKTTLLVLLIFLALIGLCQTNNFSIAAASKALRSLDSTKFQYVIHDKGSDLITILRADDITNWTGISAVAFSQLVRMDKTLKDLPFLPEESYASWNNETSSWDILKGGLKEIEKLHTEDNCNLAHIGKFKYTNNPDASAYIIRKGNKHTEHYREDKYFTEFKIIWLSECNYELTFIKSNDSEILKFLKEGDTLTVEISNVSEKGYNYKANLKGNISEGSHLKIE